MAAAKVGGLGKKGLDSLIVKKDEGVVLADASNQFPVEVDIDKVEPNKNQPRKHFDEDALQELSENIKLHGIINPLIVQDRNGYYEIIGGERRWRAARMAGLKKVPVVVKHLTEREFVEISLIDNIQRENLNPIEEAMAYKRLIEEYELKQDEVAERVSKSRTTVTNSMRLLKLDPRVQDMVAEDKLTTGHARAMLAISDADKQFEFAERAFDEKMSVREVEREIKKMQEDKKVNEKSKENVNDKLAAIYRDEETCLKAILDTKVLINAKNSNSGKLEIEYYSQDQLNNFLEYLKNYK
ncbi:MAG: ParB/RepB/Spo0J family partition protein [Pseudobutyrivibrio sp.]|nr:ParB/RepB/Spo0J family partition protein [Pseudobutyrivibrio sp.]